MQPIARCDLCGLHRESLAKTLHLPLQRRILCDEFSERLGIAPVRCAVSLDHHSGRAASVSHQQGQTGESLVADETNLHRFSVRLNCQNRNQPCVHKVHGLDGFSRIMQHLVKLQPDEFQFRERFTAFLARERQKNLVLKGIAVTVDRRLWSGDRNGRLFHHNGSLRGRNLSDFARNRHPDGTRRKDARGDTSRILPFAARHRVPHFARPLREVGIGTPW